MTINVISNETEWKVQFVLDGKTRTAKCSFRKNARGQYYRCFTFQGVVYSFWNNTDGTAGGLKIEKVNPSFYRNSKNVKLTEV